MPIIVVLLVVIGVAVALTVLAGRDAYQRNIAAKDIVIPRLTLPRNSLCLCGFLPLNSQRFGWQKSGVMPLFYGLRRPQSPLSTVEAAASTSGGRGSGGGGRRC